MCELLGEDWAAVVRETHQLSLSKPLQAACLLMQSLCFAGETRAEEEEEEAYCEALVQCARSDAPFAAERGGRASGSRASRNVEHLVVRSCSRWRARSDDALPA